MAIDLSEYITVSERIALAIEKWPDASFQNMGTKLIEVSGHYYVEATVALYRDPNDIRPAIATAWEPIPGATPYTKDSEMMNAETSAMGRAVIAAGIPSKKVASVEEVAARQHLRAVPSVPIEIPPQETDPWSGEPVIDVYHCIHGERIEISGERNGKPYYGMGCRKTRDSGEQCPANWFVLSADGKWVPKS